MRPKSFRYSAMVPLSIIVLFVGLIRQTKLANNYWLNSGAVALNHAYDTPETSIRLLQMAQIQLTRGENIRESDLAKAGLAYLLQNNLPDAEQTWTESNLPAKTLLQYALHARQFGLPQTAKTVCDLIIRIDPAYRDSWYLKADIYASQNDYEPALATFENGLEVTEYGDFGESDFYFRIGEIYALFLPDADLEAAQTMYLLALEKNDFRTERDLIRTRFLHAEAYRLSGQLESAMTEYNQVLLLNQNHYWANVRLGQLIWNKTQSLVDTEILLQRAIASNAEDKGAYRVLGAIYLENGRLADAQTMYEKILTLNPADHQAIQALESLQMNQP